ncbi:MAG: ABC-F family ATP-binding cassette domain-containing protein, partial [Ruminiclostridium sp.]|nr:ABC-F family ATP-binding cassette domain-containing protein [Ruminiclostridium sp.]
DQTGVRTALGSFLFSGEDVFKKIGSLSGGEKARVAILKLMLSGCNLLLLDEPTNHLDITSREALEAAIESFDGTALIISHDRYLIKQTATRVYKLTPHGTEEVTDVIEETITSAEEQKLTAVKKEAVTDSANKADYLKRKELQSEIRKLNTRINRAEQRISELEDEIAKINEEMASPEASADYERIAELSEKLGQLQEELDAQTDEWAEASERLEEISE